MRGISARAIPAFLALTVAFAGSVSAQEAEAQPEAQVCTAELTPAHIAPSEAPIQITAVLSEDIGFSGFEAPEESGLSVVAPEDVPAEAMAAEGETPQPITMAAEANTFLVWLSSKDAQAGTYEVTLTGETGTCTATIEVEGAESSN